jgi:DNA ligase-associated metallophosphoesterase
MSDAARLRLNGNVLLVDFSGALFWPERRTLVVADLHLEKGSASAARGLFLPPYDSAATLQALAGAIARYGPGRVICLGDSFHDDGAARRLAPESQEKLRRLTTDRDWIWITGNHDPDPPSGLGGRIAAGLTIGTLTFRHQAEGQYDGAEVSGHYHPKTSVRTRARRISGRCFVSDGRRLVLPAFGAYTGGLEVLDPALAGLFPRGFTVHLLGRKGVYRFPKSALAATLLPGAPSLSRCR